MLGWKLRISTDDFKSGAQQLYSIHSQSEHRSNDPNLNPNNNRMSNIDRLRLLAADDLNANDYSLLGQLDRDNNESMLKGMNTSQLRQIPTNILDSTLDIDCTICLGKQGRNDQIRTLPCNHEFHSECIDLWLVKRAHCPMCKTKVLPQQHIRTSPEFQIKINSIPL